MGTQCVKVVRDSGRILWRGYNNPDTRMSEAFAECVNDNFANKDPRVGFIVIGSGVKDPDEILERIDDYTVNNRYGFNHVFGEES